MNHQFWLGKKCFSICEPQWDGKIIRQAKHEVTALAVAARQKPVGGGAVDWVAAAERSSSMCNHRWWIHKGRQKHRKKKNVFEWISTNVGFNILQTDTFHTVKIKQGCFKIWVSIFGSKFDCGCWLKYLQWIFTKHLKALNWFKL